MHKNKLICLNIAGGRYDAAKLLEFFQKHADVDVFCLQESLADPVQSDLIYPGEDANIHFKIMELLPHHAEIHAENDGEAYANAILWNRRELMKTFSEITPIFSGQPRGQNCTLVQICLDYGETGFAEFMVATTHGIWESGTKIDTQMRSEQSYSIIDQVTKYQYWNEYGILCGDFNLLPDTASIKAFEKTGMRNLVTEYGITDTRTIHCKRSERYADYVLVGSKINIHEFKVLPDVVSDHAPLYLEFSLE